VEAINTQNLAALDEVCLPELAQQWRGGALEWLYGTFADHHVEIVSMVSEGDTVAVRFKTSGRHTGELEGVPATGKHWTNVGMGFYTITDGKIATEEVLFDTLGHLKQLGARVIPSEE
jgi:steroid delta-isomerase-like uncharacterized protein